MNNIVLEENQEVSFSDREKSLNVMESTYWSMIKPRSGTFYLKGRPGMAKSAIGKKLAEKLDLNYIDIRLSMVDEVDVGLYPYLFTEDNIKALDYAVPTWALEANKKPTLIHFEELNRASLAVRNAALQILNERAIGSNFKFNENVYMMSSGNLGEEDGTEVEEFDFALNNRLIHFQHEMSLDEWIKYFAEEHVQSNIISYLLSYPSDYYLSDKSTKNSDAKPTPRSWTFLSDYITCHLGKNAKPGDIFNLCKNTAICYVGAAAAPFINFLQELDKIDYRQILENYDECASIISKMFRATKSHMLHEISKLKYQEIIQYPKGLENLVKFLNNIDLDERTGFILNVLDETDYENMDDVKYWKYIESNFSDIIEKITASYTSEQEEANVETVESSN